MILIIYLFFISMDIGTNVHINSLYTYIKYNIYYY